MPRSPRSDNSAAVEEAVEAMDDSPPDSDDERDFKSRETDQPSPMTAPRKLDIAPSTLQLFRSESQSRRHLAPGQDVHAHKAQSLEVLTEMMSIEVSDPSKVAGFDPSRWIVAAGLLEKRRDGRMREGWAKRWFVLGKHTLYYYLLPKTDTSGYTPLLGDERGQIKLVDIQEVQAHARDKEHWYLTVTVALVRKNAAAQLFGAQVSQLVLRTPAETGQLWMEAIINARDAAKNGASPNRGFSSSLKKTFDSLPTPLGGSSAGQLQSQGSSSEGGNDGTPPVMPVANVVQPPVARQHRPRRDSTKLRALDLVPLEESFPFAAAVPVTPFLVLIIANTAAGFFSVQLGLESHVADWAKAVPSYVYLLVNALIIALYVELKRRSIKHNAVAREARFRVELLRKEINSLATELPVEVAQSVLLPTTTSEIVRAEEAVKHERHIAGSSMQRKVQMVAGTDFMTWNDALGCTFKLRVGPNYKKNGGKAPSGDSLYTLVGMDLLRSTDRISNVGGLNKLVLPPHRPGVDPSMEDLRKAGIPRLFIVNAQVPDKSPVLMGKQPDDAGYSLVFYFTAKPQLVKDILAGNLSPATKLLKQYVKEHKTNPDIRRRFKAIGMADNAKDLGIPGISSIIDKFNGKPAIINKVAEIYESGPDMDWFEVDISIFDFPYVAKKTLSALKDRVSEIALKAGFVFQGELDEELPETLLGGADICGLDFRLAKVM